MPSLNTENAILSNAIKVNSSYNVGIGGAASGSFKLNVTGTSNLTGALSGTSATFSGAMRSNGVEITNSANADILDIFQSPSALNSFIDYPSGRSLILRNKGSLGGLTLASTGAATFSGDIIYNNAGNQNLVITSGAANNGRMYIYGAGAADIGFQAGGNSWFLNNLGIGTNSPNAARKLDVNGVIRSNAYDVFYNSALSGYLISENQWVGGSSANLALAAETGNAITFFTNGSATERMRITSGGNVGIGTSSPNLTAANRTVLDINGTNTSTLSFSSGGTNKGYLYNDGTNLTINTSGVLSFETAATERMRITSGGLVAIGGANNTFIDYSSNVARFYGGSGTNTFGLGAGSTIYYQGDNSQFYPTTDNARSMGLGSLRYTAIWAVNGTIQTSDAREKTDVINSDLGLDFVTKLRPVSFKWKIGQNIETTETIIDEDGNEKIQSTITPRTGIRTHYGLIAQEVEELLDGKDFGGFIHDKESDVKGLRYDQFVPLLIKAIQEQQAQIEAQQQQINSLINR